MDGHKELIQKLNVTESELDHERHLLVKGDGINVDRLDYFIRDLLAVGGIFQPEYASIVHNLVLDGGLVKCSDIDTARLIFNKFLQVNEEVYFDSRVEVASIVLATILKKMLEEKLLHEADLFMTDEHVFEKIGESRFAPLLKEITSNIAFSVTDEPTEHPATLRKLRYIDPEIVGVGLLTDSCQESKDRLERYLQRDTKIYYDIPLLKKFT